MFRIKIPWGILLSLIALACLFSLNITTRIGGVRTVVLIVVVCTFFARYHKGDCPFPVAVRRSVQANGGVLFLLGWFYFGVIFAAVRGEMDFSVEWKFHAASILALVYGLFLVQNPKFTRYAVYITSVVLLYHALGANQYVSSTGMDLREALDDMSGMMGHTDYWTEFAMLSILLVANLMKERNKIIKVVGFFVALYLYKTILFCGFATPVALFLIGHMLLGIVYFRYGKKGVLQIAVRLGLAAVLILGSIWAVYKISNLEGDSRFANVQYRFRNMIEDPQGGGYEIQVSRFDLAKISWASFKKSPFFGIGGIYLDNPGCGGHHAFVDYLAIYGLLGGGGAFLCFVVLCMWNAYRRCRLERDWNSFASFACAGIFLVVGLVNPGWTGGPLTALVLYALPFKRSLKANQLVAVPVANPRFEVSRPAPYTPFVPTKPRYIE